MLPLAMALAIGAPIADLIAVLIAPQAGLNHLLH